MLRQRLFSNEWTFFSFWIILYQLLTGKNPHSQRELTLSNEYPDIHSMKSWTGSKEMKWNERKGNEMKFNVMQNVNSSKLSSFFHFHSCQKWQDQCITSQFLFRQEWCERIVILWLRNMGYNCSIYNICHSVSIFQLLYTKINLNYTIQLPFRQMMVEVEVPTVQETGSHLFETPFPTPDWILTIINFNISNWQIS
jgi:hypothetical protein